MTWLHHRVDPKEITEPLRDLHDMVVLLAPHVAIDFASNGISLNGRVTEQFTPHERLVLIYLCFNLLHTPDRWVPVEELVDNMFPLPEGEDTYSPNDPEHSVRQIVTRLRRKFGEEQYHPTFLLCARNIGYQLHAEQGYGYAFVHMYE